MLGEIIEIKENIVIVKCQNINTYNNIMNNYVLLRDTKNIIGEIISIQKENIYINLLGEIKDNTFIFGITTKPSFKSNVQLVSENNIPFILSYQSDERKSLYLGKSAIYENISIHINLNRFFNSHFAILGGTGSGKSFGFARIVQNIFNDKNYIPYKASLFIFDDPLVHCDPKYRADIIKIIDGCRKDGAILLLSQIADGIDDITDLVVFLKRGSIYKNVYDADGFENEFGDVTLNIAYKEVFKNA